MSDITYLTNAVNRGLEEREYEPLSQLETALLTQRLIEDGQTYALDREVPYVEWIIGRRQPCEDAPDTIREGVLGKDTGRTWFLTTFSGGDIMYVVNDRVCGEISSIHWEELMLQIPMIFGADNPKPIHGHMIVHIFGDKTSVEKALFESDGPLRLGTVFANEYGQKSIEYFLNPRFKQRIGGTSVDNVAFEDTYFFEADKLIRSRIPDEMPIHFEDGSFNQELFTLGREGLIT